MLQGGSDEGPQVKRFIGHADAIAVDRIGHVPLQGDEVESVYVFPGIEMGVNLVHGTILFLIEQSASFCHRGFWLLGWRPSKGALDAQCKDRKKNDTTTDIT